MKELRQLIILLRIYFRNHLIHLSKLIKLKMQTHKLNLPNLMVKMLEID